MILGERTSEYIAGCLFVLWIARSHDESDNSFMIRKKCTMSNLSTAICGIAKAA
jgi:hypothetical protein